jgi:shikimate/quinate 5-dehydrogenase
MSTTVAWPSVPRRTRATRRRHEGRSPPDGRWRCASARGDRPRQLTRTGAQAPPGPGPGGPRPRQPGSRGALGGSDRPRDRPRHRSRRSSSSSFGRTPSHAKRLADSYGARAITPDRLEQAAAWSDIVISATGAPHPVLARHHLRRSLALPGRPCGAAVGVRSLRADGCRPGGRPAARYRGPHDRRRPRQSPIAPSRSAAPSSRRHSRSWDPRGRSSRAGCAGARRRASMHTQAVVAGR